MQRPLHGALEQQHAQQTRGAASHKVVAVPMYEEPAAAERGIEQNGPAERHVAHIHDIVFGEIAGGASPPQPRVGGNLARQSGRALIAYAVVVDVDGDALVVAGMAHALSHGHDICDLVGVESRREQIVEVEYSHGHKVKIFY